MNENNSMEPDFLRNRKAPIGIRIKQQIPNVFTLLNLFFGCAAIVATVQPGLTYIEDTTGEYFVSLPEQAGLATLYIALAALVDFLDGFLARWLKATSEMGKQLDSLSDVVSFGVAPGMIAYQFLRLTFSGHADGLDVSIGCLLPAFILPCAAAYRLARFNLLQPSESSANFIGLPTPAVGLFFACFPMIYWHGGNHRWLGMLLNEWTWYCLIAICSYLMVSDIGMLSLKVKKPSIKALVPFLLLVIIALIGSFFIKWWAAPLTFLSYILISLFTVKKIV